METPASVATASMLVPANPWAMNSALAASRIASRLAGSLGNADKALSGCDSVHTCLVVERTGGDIDWDDQRDIWYHDALAKADANCEPEWVDSEDPLFTLYTSGSTGKPKGVAGLLRYTTGANRNDVFRSGLPGPRPGHCS